MFENLFGSKTSSEEEIFFNTLFLISGHMAQLDGTISESETTLAHKIMKEDFKLPIKKVKLATELYKKGTQSSFKLEPVLKIFMQHYSSKQPLKIILVDALVRMALADEDLHFKEQKALQEICLNIRLDPTHLQNLLNINKAESLFTAIAKDPKKAKNIAALKKSEIIAAYYLLESQPKDDLPTIETNYTRLCHQYNPKKLIEKGLPKEMADFAQLKLEKFSHAHELVKEYRIQNPL